VVVVVLSNVLIFTFNVLQHVGTVSLGAFNVVGIFLCYCVSFRLCLYTYFYFNMAGSVKFVSVFTRVQEIVNNEQYFISKNLFCVFVVFGEYPRP